MELGNYKTEGASPENGELLYRIIPIFLSVFSLFGSAAYSQNGFESLAKVEYLIFMGNQGINECEGTLFFDNNQSIFKYRDLQSTSNTSVSQTESNESYDLNINITEKDSLEKSIYTNRLKQIIIQSAVNYNNKSLVFIKDSIPKLNWQLLEKTKTINSFSCNSAKLLLNKTEYTVWYTKEIPCFFGPFEFGQLPGLILEISSKNNSFYAIATHIKYPHREQIEVQSKVNSKFLTRIEYEELNATYLQKKKSEMLEKINRIFTKTSRGVSISKVKIEEKNE